MGFILAALLIGLLPAYIAQNKGRSFMLWWIYGALLFIVALPHSLLMKADAGAVEANALADGAKKCPECKELIKKDATVCKHCGCKLVEQSAKNESHADFFTVKKIEKDIWSKERDLTNDEYQVYLVKKYSIEKNEALGKIIANGKLFATIEDALKSMNSKEIDEHSEFLRKSTSKEYEKTKGTLGQGIYEYIEYGDGSVIAKHQNGLVINFKSLEDAKNSIGE